MKKKIVKKVFPETVEAVEKRLCPFCGESVDGNKFRDDLSVKEFMISGLCQKCQDKTFDGKK